MTNSSLSRELNLFVTHMEVEGPFIKIWAQIENKEEGTSLIERLIKRLAPKFDNGLGTPVPNTRLAWANICCALFEGGYFRARILSLNQNGSCLARFIDYGNMETLKTCDIRILDGIQEAADLQRIPALATDFILADVLPSGKAWDEEVIERILRRIRYVEYPGRIVSVVGNNRFVQMLYGNQNFAEILIKDNTAVPSSLERMMRAYDCFQQSQINAPKLTTQIPMQSHPTVRENFPKKYPPVSVPRFQPHPDNWRMQTNVPPPKIQSSYQNDDAGVFRSRILEIGSKHEVKVSYVEDGPLMFSVQVNSTLEELNNLMLCINQMHSPQTLVEPPVIGSVCLGRYSKEKRLLRAVVMQVRENDCKLHYVDYGHGEILPYNDIYQLPRKYINPRVLSIRFTLSNVNELRVNDEMKSYFRNYVFGKTLLLHVRPSEGSPLIQYGDLYDNGQNVMDVLRGIYGNAIVPWPLPSELQLGSKEIVQVAYVESSIIFVQLDSDAPSMESLISSINEYVTNAPPFKPSQLIAGLQCVALSSEHSQWYRAEIRNVSGDNVTVFYVDYGNEETIPATSVRSICDNKITKIRAQAIRCIINDYEKEITTRELKESLENEIMAGLLAMIVAQITPAGPIVDLYDSNLDPLVNIVQRLKRASVVNGNVDSRSDNHNDKSTSSTHSNINRSDEQPNKWNPSPRSEPSRISESNNSMERGKSNNWKNDDNETRRYDNRDNSYHNRDKEWSQNSGQQQNERFSRNEGKIERSPRDGPRYERNDRNERYDRSGDTNANTRGGRDNNRARGGFSNSGRYTGNNSRNERNNSVEKAWSDKDSDTSSRGSGRSGRRGSVGGGGRGSGARGRREGGRTPINRDNEGDGDRGNLKNGRTTNGASLRIRDSRRDFGEKNENKQFDTWTNKTPPILKKVCIPLPNITVGAVKNCEIVYINSPGDFYVQLSPDNLELDPVMASIATIYETGGKILDRSSLKRGIDCVAQYSADSTWYRASVQSVEANGATVRFVDYGNVEIVEFDKIKELEADCAKLSAQAIGCKLLGASKITWDTEEIDKFSRLIDDKCLEAEFVADDNNIFEILLREVDDEKASTTYINEEFCDGADLTKAKNNARFKGRQGQIVAPTTDYAPIDEKWSVEIIDNGAKENIIITWFTNPHNFYCQTLARKNEFSAMMIDIQQVYATRRPINEPPQIGSAVMAVFSDDGALYRAEILELNKPRGNIVRYVDFGNTAMVEQRNTYRVEKKFMKIPKQAFNCSLKNIVPGNGSSWAKSNKQEIDKCFEGENFESTFHEIKDGKYIVSLNKGDVDVAGLLVEKSLASFAVSAHVNVEKNEVEPMEKPQIEELPRFDISLLAGQVLRVKVSNVGSATKFHIQLPSANASEKIIDAYMAKNDPKVMPRLSYREVCLGAGCLVNTDEGWRRAVVVNCSRTTGYDVRLIDTGANDEIPLDCMLALPGQLSVMQNQAVECCLKNATTNIVLDEKLRDRIENTNVIVAVDEVDNNRIIVKLYDTNGNSIKLSADDENETICPVCPMPILYSTQQVAVSHAEHSSSVWLKRNIDFDADAQLLAIMFDHYSVSRDNEKKFLSTPGTLCAAKSSDDNWYRSIILRATDNGAIVQYIDYGNSEEVSNEWLRVLEPQFYSQHQLAIEVALTVKLDGSIDQQREILKSHIINEEFIATLYNVRKKWIAELKNSEGKISEKLNALEAIDKSTKRQVQAVIREMIVGERYKVICHHADSPASFWLQRQEEILSIEQLQERLQIDATSCPTLMGIPEENTICLAMYSVDDMWYRAEVIIADSEITTVRFIDFGNTDIVFTNQGKSKEITDSLKSIKRYATKCRLDVIPYGSEDWMSAAIDWFEAIVTSVEDMEALVIADSTPRRVELFAGDKSLVDELVRLNYATRINNEDDLIEEIVEREVDPRAAYVSHAISPNEFWIQQEKYVGDLEILADRFIVADMFPKPKSIVEGLLCVAKFPEDESWYRARVVSHGDTGTEVIYIDYGNSAVSTEIREIPEDVAVQPPFSKKCRLSMPDSVEQWSEEACVEFVKMAAEGATIFQLEFLEERDDTSIVRLTRDGKDIVENLTKLCTIEVPIIDERLSPLGEENSPNVLVSHVNSPSDFYIQAESSINELETMVDHLASAESFLPFEKIDEGMICAAKFPEDEQWYRAKILSHGDAGTEVLYIDYGNSAVTTELRVLPEDIVKKSALSTCCSLRMPDDVESWSRDACEKFFDLVNDGITMFQYELLENREQSVVRLCIDDNDIVDILSALCAKRQVNDTASRDVDETLRSLKNVIQDEIVDSTSEDCTETSAHHQDTYSEEIISSNETSGVEVITISDTSSLSSFSKSEISMENSTLQAPESASREEIIFDCTTSNDNVTDSTTPVSDAEKVSNVEKFVENVASIENIVGEIRNMEKVAEANSNIEKVVEDVTSMEKDAEKVSNSERVDENVTNIEAVSNVDKVVEVVSNVDKVVEVVPSVEKIVEKVPNVEKDAEEATLIEKIIEKVPSIEGVTEKTFDNEKIVEEASKIDKIIEKVSAIEKVAEETLDIEKASQEASNMEKVIEKVSSVEKLAEKIVETLTIENVNDKVAEKKEFALSTKQQEPAIVDKELTISETTTKEEILPQIISRDLSEKDINNDPIEKRNSITLEDKIVTGIVEKVKDLTVDDSTGEQQSTREVLAKISVETRPSEDSFVVHSRKLSIGEKDVTESVIENDSSNNEAVCSTAPKIQQSENIVTDVLRLQDKIDDSEKSEIISVLTDENIPK